jgi:hypothetical protein
LTIAEISSVTNLLIHCLFSAVLMLASQVFLKVRWNTPRLIYYHSWLVIFTTMAISRRKNNNRKADMKQ